MENIISLLLILLATILPSQAQTTNSPCTNYNFKQPHDFKTCVDLPVLNSALHYTYHPNTKTLDIAYCHPGMGGPTSSKWVAWALNPTAKGMVGAQALVAYRSPKDGSLVAYTSPITSYGTTLAKGDLSFNVTGLNAEISKDDIIIFATIKVPNNGTVLNQLWQEGPLSNNGTPERHALSGPNVRSMASLNLLSGGVSPAVGVAPAAGASYSSRKNIHGFLNVVSWGILMPLGGMIANGLRELPSADPLWFYLHVGCQLTGYIIGVSGWVFGLVLTSGAHHVHYPVHRYFSIILFCTATLQVISGFIRPKKGHRYRVQWNTFHHNIGAATIVLGIINVFRGFDILEPEQKWKIAYICVLVALVIIFLTMEVIRHYIIGKKNSEDAQENISH